MMDFEAAVEWVRGQWFAMRADRTEDEIAAFVHDYLRDRWYGPDDPRFSADDFGIAMYKAGAASVAPVKRGKGRPANPAHRRRVRAMVGYLVASGMTATRGDGQPAVSACDAVAEGTGRGYEAIVKIWTKDGPPRRLDECELFRCSADGMPFFRALWSWVKK